MKLDWDAHPYYQGVRGLEVSSTSSSRAREEGLSSASLRRTGLKHAAAQPMARPTSAATMTELASNSKGLEGLKAFKRTIPSA